MKSIRSITPYDVRFDKSSDNYLTQNSDAKRSINGSGTEVQAFSTQPYNIKLDYERQITPESSTKLLSDVSHKKTLNNHFRDSGTKSPNRTCTNIVDKISSYQKGIRLVLTKAPKVLINDDKHKYSFEDRYKYQIIVKLPSKHK